MSHIYQIEILDKIIAALNREQLNEAKDWLASLDAPGILDWPEEAAKDLMLLMGSLNNPKQYSVKEMKDVAKRCKSTLQAIPERLPTPVKHKNKSRHKKVA